MQSLTVSVYGITVYEPDLINIAYILIGKSDFDGTLYTICNHLIFVSLY